MGKNCGSNHAKTNGEASLVRHAVLRFKIAVCTVVCTSEFTSAVLRRTCDPAKAGLELLLAPCLCFFCLAILGIAVALFVEAVGALAPDECFFDATLFAVRFKKSQCFFFELFNADVCHGDVPFESARAGQQLLPPPYLSPTRWAKPERVD